MQFKQTRTVWRTMRIQISGKELIEVVRQEMKAQGITEGLPPDDAAVDVFVPGGGDWSNTRLDIDEKTPIEIHWKEVKHAQD